MEIEQVTLTSEVRDNGLFEFQPLQNELLNPFEGVGLESPQGGGAQSGLGEKFSPNLFTGTGNFSVPVTVPLGRNGFQPELTLCYSSGNRNDVFGLGWTLGILGITRKTSRGIPVYSDDLPKFA